MDTDSFRIRLQILWVRIRGWITLTRNLGAIAMFLVGVAAVYRAHTVAGMWNPSLFGYDVPAVAGFSEYETLLFGGILVMMLGLGFSYRWFVSDRKAIAHYE